MSDDHKTATMMAAPSPKQVRSLRCARALPRWLIGALFMALPLTAAAQDARGAQGDEVGGSYDELDAFLFEDAPADDASDGSQSAAGEEQSAEPEVLETIPLQHEAPALPPPRVAPGRQIEEIVVTATKREENLRDIPASITALSGEELAQRGAQDTADIIKLVPGANLTSTGDSPARVTIRGISSDIGTSSTTGTLFGNVSFSDAYVPFAALDPNPFDMASVEVLKGPQGTLYGASALNGAVRYVPQGPGYDEWAVKYFAQYTSIQDGDAQPTYGAAVNVPLVEDRLALRVMGFDRTAPGFVDNQGLGIEDTNQLDQRGVRSILGWRPGDAWDIQLMGAYQTTLLQDVGISDARDGRLVTRNRPRRSPNKTCYSILDLSINYDFDWAQLVSDTSFVHKEGNNFFDASSRNTGSGALPIVAQVYTGDSDTYGQELRLVSNPAGDSRWKWTAGLFAWQQDLITTLTVPLAVDVTPAATLISILQPVAPDLATLFASSGAPIVLRSAADVRIRELAAFGDLTRRFGEDVEVTVGGRLYQTTSGGENAQSGAFVLAQRGASPFVLEADVKERGFNPKISATWHVTDDILTYALASKGFRVGGVQFGVTTPLSQNQAPDVFKSDTLWNYELGVRTQWFDNTLRLDLTGYFVDWDEPQSLQLDASGIAVYIDNVGGVESQGADLSLQYLFPWAGLSLTSSASFAETVTSEPFTGSDGSVFPAGTRWPLAPEMQIATTMSFMQPAGSWMVGGFATYTQIEDTVPFFGGQRIFDYHQVDLQMSLANPLISWLPQVALIFNNVTNERGITNAFSSGVPTPEAAANEYYYITPRSFTLRISGQFGG